MKKYIDFNTEKRMNADNDFEKDFFKLMINSVHGETMENLWKTTNLRLVNITEDIKQNILASQHTLLTKLLEKIMLLFMKLTPF